MKSLEHYAYGNKHDETFCMPHANVVVVLVCPRGLPTYVSSILVVLKIISNTQDGKESMKKNPQKQL
jgi:hypothetical protein